MTTTTTTTITTTITITITSTTTARVEKIQDEFRSFPRWCKSSLNLEITRDTYAYYATASSKLVCPADGRASSVKLTSGSNFWIERTGSRLRLERSKSGKRKEEDRAGRINSIEQRRKKIDSKLLDWSRFAFQTWTVKRELARSLIYLVICITESRPAKHLRKQISNLFPPPSFFF